MSIEAVHWALSVPVGGSAKVILLGLANHAHPDGSESYPALSTLAKYGNCDRSTARRNVRKLVIDGWVEQDGTGPQGQRKYRLLLDRHTGLQNATGGVAPAPVGGGTDAPLGVARVPPEPSINRPEEQPPKPPQAGASDSPLSLVVDDVAPLKPTGNRKTEHRDYELAMAAWASEHFPRADHWLAVASVANDARSFGATPTPAAVERHARRRGELWLPMLGLDSEGKAA